jgi:hypothetical protein
MAKLTDDYIRKMIQWRNSTLPGALEALEELLELRERTRWIPVTEALPVYRKECLVFYLARGLMFKAEYSHDGWCDASGEISDELLENVTHWIEIPEPPEV